MPGEEERGGQIKAIRRAIAARDGKFTVGDIGDDMRRSGMPIVNIAVGRALKRLASKGELSIAVRGVGNEPNHYVKADRFQPA